MNRDAPLRVFDEQVVCLTVGMLWAGGSMGRVVLVYIFGGCFILFFSNLFI